ncbi:hypothetical protein GCM10009712_02270 [Pseudarthrobacter sulfonivorans]
MSWRHAKGELPNALEGKVPNTPTLVTGNYLTPGLCEALSVSTPKNLLEYRLLVFGVWNDT